MHYLPEAFYTRSPILDDVGIVVDLIERCQQREWGLPDIDAEDILKLWKLPEVDLRLDAWMVFNTDNQLVAYAHLLRHNVPHMSVYMQIHHDYSLLDLSSNLLANVEKRAY